MEYFCSICRQPTQPRLYEPGAGAVCHPESWLMVLDDRAPLFAKELATTILQAWQSGMDSHTMHVYYFSPVSICECDACERGRDWEEVEGDLDDDWPNWNPTRLRDITEAEERDLAAELWTEQYNEMGPHERAYNRWLDRE